MSVTARINRLFAIDGKCVNVAIDHGFFNEWDFLSGIEDITSTVTALVATQPDAIQLSVGQARHLQSMPGKQKPSLVLRSDVANVYGKEMPGVLFSHSLDDIVEHALRLDATCVVVNLFRIPNQPDVHHQCVKNISSIKAQCERFGMPLMVEPLVFRPNSEAGGYMIDGDVRKIVPLVRQATELGADIIKADPTDNLEDYPQVIRAASDLPVLPRGGGKVSNDELFSRTKQLMQHGAAGIVYGRNIIQHNNPKGMVQALMSIVHGNVESDTATAVLLATR